MIAVRMRISETLLIIFLGFACLTGVADSVLAAPGGMTTKPGDTAGGDFSLTPEMIEGLGKVEWKYSREAMKEAAKKEPVFRKALRNMKSQLKANPHKFYKNLGHSFIARIQSLERRLQKLVAKCEQRPPAPCGTCEYFAWSSLIGHEVSWEDPVIGFVRPPIHSYTGGAIAFNACMKKLKKKQRQTKKQKRLCNTCDPYIDEARKLHEKNSLLSDHLEHSSYNTIAERQAMKVKLRDLISREDTAWAKASKCQQKFCVQDRYMLDSSLPPIFPPHITDFKIKQIKKKIKLSKEMAKLITDLNDSKNKSRFHSPQVKRNYAPDGLKTPHDLSKDLSDVPELPALGDAMATGQHSSTNTSANSGACIPAANAITTPILLKLPASEQAAN